MTDDKLEADLVFEPRGPDGWRLHRELLQGSPPSWPHPVCAVSCTPGWPRASKPVTTNRLLV